MQTPPAADWLLDGPADARHSFLFAHGAGAGMDHPFMTGIAEGLAAEGIRVLRFEFPYMARRREDGKKRPPDRLPTLLEAFRGAIEQLPAESVRVIGGKSMGGRVASLLAAEAGEALGIAGLIALGFPFHPPGKPDNFRGEHLAALRTPTLILQGERDPFGTEQEVSDYSLSSLVQTCFLPDGEHSFKPRKRSGLTLEQNLDRAVAAMAAFIRGLPA